MVFIPFRLRNQKWDTYHLSGTQLCGSTVRLGSRRIHAEGAAKHGLGKSLLDELVQRTLDGSVQRPCSPEADRARPAATVPPWMGRPD